MKSALPTLALAAVCAVGLAACGSSDPDSSDGSAGPAPTSTADVGQASDVTPLDDATITAAKEEGSLLMYTNSEDQQTAPLIKAFEKEYPEVEVRTISLGDAEMFQRYETETATGAATADVVMASDAVGWLNFIADGNVEDYEDPNLPNLPDYADLAPGVVAMSEDPVIAVFNKAILPEDQQPHSMAELGEMAGSLKGKIGATDITNAVQYGATAAYIGAQGDDGWDVLDKIGPSTVVEASNGPLVTKLAQGQYTAAFFVSGSVRAFIVGDAAKVVNYSYLEDGTPLLPRAIAVTSDAASPNAAKLFVNFTLSVEGQKAACEGGYTPYRDGVTCNFGLPAIEAVVGKDNMVYGTFDQSLADDHDATVERWNEAFGR